MSALLELLSAESDVLSWCGNCKTDAENAMIIFMLSFTCLLSPVLIKDDVEIMFTAVIVKEFVTQRTLTGKKKVNIDWWSFSETADESSFLIDDWDLMMSDWTLISDLLSAADAVVSAG